ncbi:MAG: hemolysin family protein [Nitrococcus sp.]|nr:hemolysin family protein [Nitrococcus sp.]
MLTVSILIILILIVMNGVFALSEMAVVSSRRARLQQRVEEGNRAAAVAQDLVDDPGRFLSTIQIGITLIGVATGAFGGATIAEKVGIWLHTTIPALVGSGQTIGLGIVVAITAYLTLIFGELVPKRIALRNPELMASLIARPMSVLSRIAAPAVWLLDTSTEGVLKLLRLHKGGKESVTEEEVRSMISEGTRHGVFDPREEAMIEGVLRLDDRSARSVMVPRQDVLWLDIDDALQTVRSKIEPCGYSRFLVCRGEIDEFLGIVSARDILDSLLREEPFELAKFLAAPVVVPEGVPILRLLDQFKSAGVHLAVVVDEYGGLEGIATMRGVMEVIAGALPEHWEDAREQAIQRKDGTWLVDGMMETGDFEKVLGLSGIQHDKDYHTVAGFVLHCLEDFPTEGDSASWNGIRFEIIDMDGRRIDKVLVTLPVEADSETQTDGEA